MNKLPKLGEIIYWEILGSDWLYEDIYRNAKKYLGAEVTVSRMILSRRLIRTLDALKNLNFLGFEELYYTCRNCVFYVGLVKVEKLQRIDIKNALQIAIRKDKYEWKVEPGMEPVVKLVQDGINYWTDRLSSVEISQLLVQYILHRGVRLRNHGGFYFIARKHIELADKLEQFCNSIGNIKVGRIGLIDEQRTINEIVELFNQEVKEKVEEIKEYIKGIQDGVKFRSDGYERRLEELQGYREKVQEIFKAISISSRELEEQLENIEQKMVELKIRGPEEVDIRNNI